MKLTQFTANYLLHNSNLIHKTLTIISLWLFCISSAFSSTLSSTVNRNTASINQTITLTVAYDERVESKLLDYKALEVDFEIIGVAPKSSSSFTVINGKTTRTATTVWNITLAAKREGKLTIPSFSINNDVSKPITIIVKSTAGNNNVKSTNSNSPLHAWVSADKSSVYPSEQIIVEIELSADSDVSNLSATQLKIDGADVTLLKQQESQRIDNGISRQIVTLKFAVFAKQAGTFNIPVMHFTGMKGGQRNVYNRFASRGKQVTARTQSLPITVKEPIQTSSTQGNTWFPADSVSIRRKWSSDPTSMKVGEPITRSIEIVAQGQQASAIPPLLIAANSAYKTYKDQAKLDTKTTNKGYVGTRIESEAIVPSSSGELVLEEIKLSWFNINTEQWQTAVLPAETIMVAASDVVNAGANDLLKENQASLAQTGDSNQTNSHKASLFWQLISAALAIICLLQFWFLTKIKSKNNTAYRRRSKGDLNKEKEIGESAAWKELRAALVESHTPTVRNKLIAWLSCVLPKQKTFMLADIANYSNDSTTKKQLESQLSMLESSLYSDGENFNLSELGSVLTLFRKELISKQTKRLNSKPSLNPLYPNQN